MTRPAARLLVAAAATLSLASTTHALVTVVASTGQTIGGVTITSFFQRPDINGTGHVVFAGSDNTGASSIFVDHSVLLTAGAAVGTQTFASVYAANPVINNLGNVGFIFRNPSSTTFVGTFGPSANTSLSLTPFAGKNLLSIGQVAINDSNAIIFNTSFFSGVSTQAIAAYPPASIPVQDNSVIAGNTLTGFNGAGDSSLNNNGTLVFRAFTGSGTYLFTQSARLVGTGSTIGGITLSNVNPDAAINNAGQIAFQGIFGNDTGIFTSTRVVAIKGQTLAGRILGHADSSVDINESGQVAFLTPFVGGGQGIFVDDKLAVATGQTVGGRTIASLGRPALSDNGSIAAYATFTDGSSAILTATALQHLTGDTNDDGVVDLTDLNNVLNNFGSHVANNVGDENKDDTVDLTDLNNVLNNFGNHNAADALATMPEPASFLLLATGYCLLTTRRVRRRLPLIVNP